LGSSSLSSSFSSSASSISTPALFAAAFTRAAANKSSNHRRASHDQYDFGDDNTSSLASHESGDGQLVSNKNSKRVVVPYSPPLPSSINKWMADDL
jgi:hypothetical protein